MSTTFFTVELAQIECCECGVSFGISTDLKKNLLKNKRNFWCPNGHAQHFVGETEEDRLRKRVDGLKNDLSWHKSELGFIKNSLRAHKAAHTRTKKRVGNGVCPCCNRHFTNLHEHMKHQHPEYVPDDSETEVDNT